MESIEQPFGGITNMGLDVHDTRDKVELIDNDQQHSSDSKIMYNGDSPRAENSPLHQGKLTNSLLHGPQNHGLRVIIISSIVFAVAITVALILTIYLEPKEVHGHAAVASVDPRCSQIGLQILRDGGNAVDAAIAAALCEGVVNPALSGIGGGGFAIVHDHKFLISTGYDFREVAPANLKSLTESDSLNIRSAGVPGTLKGFSALHQAHGVIPWKDVVSPAIELAREPFSVSESLVKDVFPKLVAKDFVHTSLSHLLLGPDNQFKKLGDNMTYHMYADMLEAVQADPDALYSGDLLTPFVNDVMKLGGQISEEDMRNYTVIIPTIIKSKLKDLTVVGMPPPASGAVIAMVLNVVDQFGWKEKMKDDPLVYQQLIDTFRIAFEHRSVLGDPRFDPGMSKNIEELIGEDLAKNVAELIKQDNHTSKDTAHYGPTPPPTPDQGTIHLSVIDSSELMVSLTISLNSMFGNRYVLPSSGIILNNVLMDFDLDPKSQSANSFAPGKRPLSSMSPTVVFNNEHPCAHRVVIGASNGTRIITGVSETIINSVVFNMNISAAVKAPRVHTQLGPDTLYEESLPQSVVKELQRLGYSMIQSVEGLSIVQAIEKTNDNLLAFSDQRGFGKAAHY